MQIALRFSGASVQPSASLRSNATLPSHAKAAPRYHARPGLANAKNLAASTISVHIFSRSLDAVPACFALDSVSDARVHADRDHRGDHDHGDHGRLDRATRGRPDRRRPDCGRATGHRHADECAEAVPPGQWALPDDGTRLARAGRKTDRGPDSDQLEGRRRGPGCGYWQLDTVARPPGA